MILKTRQQEREEYLKKALKENEIQISGNRIIYTNAKGSSSQKYSDKDPEERVRAFVFAELLYRYQYKPEKIWIEEEVPKRPSGDYADITIKDPNDDKTTYLVIEVKKEGISDKEVAKAIQQGYGYANYFDAKYFLFDNNEPERRTALELRKPDGSKWGGKEYEKNRIADIPFRYGKVIQYNFIRGELEHELKAADIKELESVFKKAHNILWEGGKRNPADAFDEMSKLIFTKNWDEKFTPINKPYRFQVGTHETKDDITKRIKEIYNEARRKEPKVFTEEIKAKDSKIFQVVRLLQHISLKDTDLDAKGRAFEQFMSDVFKEKLGQYFTRRELVNFTVQMLEPTEEDIIIDPASGSGGFLLYAMKIVRDLIHQKYGEHSKVEQEWIGNNIFGIEVNEQIARVAMMDMIIHDDGHTNIEEADALADFSEFDPRKDIRRSKYSMVLTNPPFGSDIKDEDVDYLDKYELGAKNNPRHRQLSEVLYLERCLDLIQPDYNDNKDNRRGGKIGIVLPDGILTNSSLWYVRQFIEEHAYILTVVSLPQFAFKKAGSGSKTSLVFLQKFNNTERQKFLKDKAKFLTQIADEFEKNKKVFSKKMAKFIDDNKFGKQIDEKQKEPKIIKQLKELGELPKYENLQKDIRTLELEFEYLNNFNPDLEAHKEVMKKWNYSIFMTIVEHIGYDATGRPDKNELFSAQNGEVSKNDLNTILGQYQIYKQNPDKYKKEGKTFVVNSGSIIVREDPHYNFEKFIKASRRLAKTNYKIKNLREVVWFIRSGATPTAKGDAYTDKDNGIPFLRVSDIKNLEIDLSNALYIKKEIHEGMLKRTQLEPNDVLLSMAGTIGISTVIKSDLVKANINQAIARLKPIKSVIDPYYLKLFLNSTVGRSLSEKESTVSNQPNINLEQIGSIKIPLPDLSIQKKILQFYELGNEKQKELSQQAEHLKQKTDDLAEKLILGETSLNKTQNLIKKI